MLDDQLISIAEELTKERWQREKSSSDKQPCWENGGASFKS